MPLSNTKHQIFRASTLVLGAALTFSNAPVFSQDESSLPNAADLQAVERDIARERAAQEQAAANAARVAEEERTLRQRMISAAEQIQDRERTLIELEAQLDVLETRRAALSETLKDKDAQMRDVVMALQRLAVRPTDALLLQPLRPADAIRSGLVLSAAIPALTETADTLRADLDALYRTRSEIVERRSDVAANAIALIEDQSQLETLYAEKEALRAGFEQRASAAAQRMEELSKEADDLRDLLNKVIADRKRQAEQEAEDARQRAAQDPLTLTPPDGAAPSPDMVTARRPAPPPQARSFTQARGTLPFPVMGQLTQRYGEETEGDVRAKGIIIKTRTEAQVVSPFDAVIAFSGPFRGYGQLLILEHSEGYHTLLAGLDRLDGTVGQRVLAGEPVGVMASNGLPSLYVELRRDGQPINPLPWLASNNNEIRG